MFARGEGNTVQYPIYAHGTEAPLSAAAYIKRTSQTEFRISGTHSSTQTLAPTSEAHTLHILKRKSDELFFFFYHYYYIIFEAAGCMGARVCVCARELVIMGCYWVLFSPTPPYHPQLVSSSSHLPSRVTRARLFLLHRIISCIFYSSSVTVVSSNHGLR